MRQCPGVTRQGVRCTQQLPAGRATCGQCLPPTGPVAVAVPPATSDDPADRKARGAYMADLHAQYRGGNHGVLTVIQRMEGENRTANEARRAAAWNRPCINVSSCGNVSIYKCPLCEPCAVTNRARAEAAVAARYAREGVNAAARGSLRAQHPHGPAGRVELVGGLRHVTNRYGVIVEENGREVFRPLYARTTTVPLFGYGWVMQPTQVWAVDKKGTRLVCLYDQTTLDQLAVNVDPGERHDRYVAEQLSEYDRATAEQFIAEGYTGTLDELLATIRAL